MVRSEGLHGPGLFVCVSLSLHWLEGYLDRGGDSLGTFRRELRRRVLQRVSVKGPITFVFEESCGDPLEVCVVDEAGYKPSRGSGEIKLQKATKSVIRSMLKQMKMQKRDKEC